MAPSGRPPATNALEVGHWEVPEALGVDHIAELLQLARLRYEGLGVAGDEIAVYDAIEKLFADNGVQESL